MPRYNDMFELSVEDMNLIETSLRDTAASLSLGVLNETEENRTEREYMLRQVHALLGKLHDQKVFYRPKDGVYLGG